MQIYIHHRLGVWSQEKAKDVKKMDTHHNYHTNHDTDIIAYVIVIWILYEIQNLYSWTAFRMCSDNAIWLGSVEAVPYRKHLHVGSNQRNM